MVKCPVLWQFFIFRIVRAQGISLKKANDRFFHPCSIIPRPNAEHHSQISMLRAVQEHLRRQPTHRTLLNGRPLNIVKGLAVFRYTLLLSKKISNKAKRPNIFRRRHVADIPLFLFIYIIQTQNVLAQKSAVLPKRIAIFLIKLIRKGKGGLPMTVIEKRICKLSSFLITRYYNF